MPNEEQDSCEHSKVIPTYTDEELEGLPSWEVRVKYPRFAGECPDCGTRLVAYASYFHYIAGDW